MASRMAYSGGDHEQLSEPRLLCGASAKVCRNCRDNLRLAGRGQRLQTSEPIETRRERGIAFCRKGFALRAEQALDMVGDGAAVRVRVGGTNLHLHPASVPQ